MPVVARIEVPPPAPFVEGEDGAEARGDGYRFIAPRTATKPLVMEAADGTKFLWTPTELVFGDGDGQLDYIAGSAPAAFTVRGRAVHYPRTFPASEEVHVATPEGRKYWLYLYEPPRLPGAHLSGDVWFGVSGMVGGVPLPPGRHRELEAFGFRFQPVYAEDTMGNRVEGWYEVIDTDLGQQLFICIPADWLLDPDRVYPVKIDPTIGVDSRTSGGWLVQFRDGTLMFIMGHYGGCYYSFDGGQSWIQGSGVINQSSLRFVDVDDNDRLWTLMFASDTGWPIRVYSRNGSSLSTYASGNMKTYFGGTVYSVRDFATRGSIGYIIGYGGGRVDAFIARISGSSVTTDDKFYGKDYMSVSASVWAAISTTVSGSYPAFAVTTMKSSSAPQRTRWSEFESENYVSITYMEGTILGLNGGFNDWYVHPSSRTLFRGYPSRKYYTIPDDVANIEGAVYVPEEDMIAVVGTTQEGKLCMKAFYPATESWSELAVFNAYPRSGAVYVPKRIKYGSAVPVAFRDRDDPYLVLFETLSFNTPPLVPSDLNRGPFDATLDAVFTWKHNDQPGDGQSMYHLQIRIYGSNTNLIDTGEVQSPHSEHLLPGGTLENGRTYQWRVRTADQAGEWSPWSDWAVFQTGPKPVATILYPTEGTTVSTSEVTVEWSVPSQSSATVRLYDGTGQTVLQEHEVTTPSARAKTITGLENNTSYQVSVQPVSSIGVVGDEVFSGPFSVQYTPPPKPTASAAEQAGFIRVTITNPAPTGDEPEVTHNDLYRRELGGEWVRVATGIAPNGTYNDYAAASGVLYEYRVRAVGANGTYTDSDVAQASVTITGGIWLHDPRDPAGTAHWFQYHELPSTDRQVIPSGAFQFAGRRYPVVQMDASQMERIVRYRLYLSDETDDRAALEALYERRTTLCLRNHRGKKYYVVFTEMPLEFERRGAWADVEFQVVDFDEEV